jgi:surface protein
MGRMFESCSQLTSLDLSGFNTSKVTSMNWMFFSCFRLKTIYVGDGWSTAAVTYSDDMFYYCSALVGGQGTTWNESNPKDKTYAHIDGGPSNPGYFTEAVTGVATNVEAVPAKANTVKGIYTLDGRKLNELPTKKGVYIVDGRKVVMK